MSIEPEELETIDEADAPPDVAAPQTQAQPAQGNDSPATSAEVPPAAPSATAAPTERPERSRASKAPLFTADQQGIVDRRVGDARKEGREAAYRYIYREAGVGSLDELRSLVDQARRQASQDSEQVQRLYGQLDEVQQRLTAVEKERDAHKGRSFEAVRIAAVRLNAAKRGFADPDDPIRFLGTKLGAVAVDPDTFVVDETVLTQALEDLATARPYLLTPAPTQEPTPAPSSPDPAVPAAPVAPAPAGDMVAAAVAAAERSQPSDAAIAPPAEEPDTDAPQPPPPPVPATPRPNDVRATQQQQSKDARDGVYSFVRSIF